LFTPNTFHILKACIKIVGFWELLCLFWGFCLDISVFFKSSLLDFWGGSEQVRFTPTLNRNFALQNFWFSG